MSDLTPDIRFLIDFNVADVAAVLGLPIPQAAAAATYGINEAALAEYCAEAEAQVAATAAEYATHPEAQCMLDALALEAGTVALAAGDSITTYRYSYARILHHLLAARGVELINAAYSGHTSNHGLELTYTQHLTRAPRLVFLKLGVNDAKRFEASGKTLVTLGEYRANLIGIIRAFQRNCGARVVVLTPTLVVENVVNTDPAIQAMRLAWRNDDLMQFAEAALQAAADTRSAPVNLTEVLGTPPDPALYVADGLHPNALGQQRLLGQLIHSLTH